MVSVEFSVKSRKMLEVALAKMFLEWTEVKPGVLRIAGGTIIDLNSKQITTYDDSYGLINKIKVKYSEAVVEAIAKKKRWALTKTAGNKFEIKRY